MQVIRKIIKKFFFYKSSFFFYKSPAHWGTLGNDPRGQRCPSPGKQRGWLPAILPLITLKPLIKARSSPLNPDLLPLTPLGLETPSLFSQESWAALPGASPVSWEHPPGSPALIELLTFPLSRPCLLPCQRTKEQPLPIKGGNNLIKTKLAARRDPVCHPGAFPCLPPPVFDNLCQIFNHWIPRYKAPSPSITSRKLVKINFNF